MRNSCKKDMQRESIAHLERISPTKGPISYVAGSEERRYGMETSCPDNKMKKKEENNACIDALLWIGNAPGKYQTANEFVKEAQLRGCCRQLPFVPSWTKFGKTKVFLAHRDKHKTPKRGSIFGYFVLHRIEIIMDNQFVQDLREKQKTNSLWPCDTQEYTKSVEKWKKETPTPEEIKRRLKKKLKRNHVPNIVKGETCRKPSSEEYDGDTINLIEDLLEELQNEILKKIQKGFLEINKDDLIVEWPYSLVESEGGRGCSIRKGPGSVYAVDALCAAIHDSYRQLLQQYLLAESKKSGKDSQDILQSIRKENQQSWKGWLKRSPMWSAQSLLKLYKGPFYEAVKIHYYGWHPKCSGDPRLRDKTHRCGELIVFNKPYPILESTPQAAFMGIWHINGDKLIDQIVEHDEKGHLIVTIYSCEENRCQDNMPIKTKAQLTNCLSRELHLSEAYARRFLDELALTTKNQLLHFDKFKLSGIGTIRIQGKKNPKIRFFPAKAISEIRTFHPTKAISEICTSRPPRNKLLMIETKNGLATWLGGQLNVKNALANRFLDELSQIACEQLINFKRFRLPGIGTIRL